MYHSVLLPAQDGPPGQDAVLLTAELMQVLADLTLYGAPALPLALQLIQRHPGLLDQTGARPLLMPLLTVAMAPLDRDGDWTAMGALLRVLDDRSAPLMEDILLPIRREGQPLDLSLLTDATVVTLAGLVDAGGRPGKALALLDSMETSRSNPRYMAMSWQARCHILGTSAQLTPLWPNLGNIGSTGLRAMARGHAEDRRMEDALAGFSAALAQATTPPARRGIGADLAVMAAWLQSHGLGRLLEAHHPIASQLSNHPTLGREALDLLLRAPASMAWEPLREGWLETARRYFQRFVPSTRAPCPQPLDYLTRCRPAA